jgi:hypothetical protein
MRIWTGAVYLLARLDVYRALRERRFAVASDFPDGVPIHLLASAADGLKERIVAEVDQDGFVFAVDVRDRTVFNSREKMVPRKHHRIWLVLSEGRICLRKMLIAREPGILGSLRRRLRWEMYIEAAALLRLGGTPGFPGFRGIDPVLGILDMDYVWGRDLRDGGIEDGVAEGIRKLVARAIDCGVIPRDIHPGNFIRARSSGTLYMVDFNLVFLRPIPGWRAYLPASYPQAHQYGRK